MIHLCGKKNPLAGICWGYLWVWSRTLSKRCCNRLILACNPSGLRASFRQRSKLAICWHNDVMTIAKSSSVSSMFMVPLVVDDVGLCQPDTTPQTVVT